MGVSASQEKHKCDQVQTEMQEARHNSEYRVVNDYNWSKDLLRCTDGIFKRSSGEYRIPDLVTIKISDELYEDYRGTGTMLWRQLNLNGYEVHLELWPRNDPIEWSAGIGKLDELLQTLDPNNQISRWELLRWLLCLGGKTDSEYVKYNNDTVHFILSELQHYHRDITYHDEYPNTKKVDITMESGVQTWEIAF